MCAYDRFGSGRSDAAPAPQTFATEADDLHALLQAAGEPGPYVVVGHSFGGDEAVAFADRFTDEVAGVLLVDASPTTWNEASCAVVDDGSPLARSFVQSCALVADPDANPEALDGPAAFAELAAVATLGDLPLTVLSAADHGFPAELDRVWRRGQAHWAALSSEGRLVEVEETGHEIQVDRPDVVTAELDALVSRLSQ